ncbi:hypothetical protein Q5752_003604 [Cryptotrichosporon argae]
MTAGPSTPAPTFADRLAALPRALRRMLAEPARASWKEDPVRLQEMYDEGLLLLAAAERDGCCGPEPEYDALVLDADGLYAPAPALGYGGGGGGRRTCGVPCVPSVRLDCVAVQAALVALGIMAALFVVYPFPTTIPVFIGAACALVLWTAAGWLRIAATLVRRESGWRDGSATYQLSLVVASLLIVYWLRLGIAPPEQYLPRIVPANPNVPEKYFIAANLYNNQDILPNWSAELLKLIEHLGPENTFVSIYESNSEDNTRALMSVLDADLALRGVEHRFVSGHDDDRWWPYPTAPERIAFLVKARNRALEPLQAPDDDVRLADWESFTKVLFLNDVLFKWDDIVRLIATREDGDDSRAPDYDLACAMDFGWSGLYDTWVARDVCGTPLRSFWPYVKDEHSIDLVRAEVPFRVGACWNGAVVYQAHLARYRRETPTDSGVQRLGKRGWKMIDNATYPNAVSSPELSLPLEFRTSDIQACDHSECFLFSYDIHRLYPTSFRPPRIVMNPQVRVAYQKNWWTWYNVVLRSPVVNWWRTHWSHGLPLSTINWLWEWLGRNRDHCTWAALNLPAHCSALPGAPQRGWGAGA